MTRAFAVWLIARDRFKRRQFTAAMASDAAGAHGVVVPASAIESAWVYLAEDTDVFELDLLDGITAFRFRNRARRGAPVSAATNNVTAAIPPHSENGVQVADGDGIEGFARADEAGSVVGRHLAHRSAPKAQHSRHTARVHDPHLVAVGADPSVRCVSPPHPDGGTSFKLEVPVVRWAPALQRLAEMVRVGKKLPRGFDFRTADGVCLTARVKRVGGGGFSLTFDDQAQLTFLPHGPMAILEAKARSIWSLGVERWMAIWFDVATCLVTGGRCTAAHQAYAVGWRTHKLELATDFVGLVLTKEDSENFVNARGGAELVSSKGHKQRGLAETINIGRRGKDALALSTHDKTQAMRSKKGVPGEAVYAATWTANGWDGRANIRRVEARARGRALVLHSATGIALDLTDPASLLDAGTLGRFWVHATTTRTRLVSSASGAASESVHGLSTDPRWIAVQAAGGPDHGDKFVRVPREERLRLTHAERIRRADEDVARALGRRAGLALQDGKSVPCDDRCGCVRHHPGFVEEFALAQTSIFPLSKRVPQHAER